MYCWLCWLFGCTGFSLAAESGAVVRRPPIAAALVAGMGSGRVGLFSSWGVCLGVSAPWTLEHRPSYSMTHGIFWIRDQTVLLGLTGRSFTNEPPGKPSPYSFFTPFLCAWNVFLRGVLTYMSFLFHLPGCFSYSPYFLRTLCSLSPFFW